MKLFACRIGPLVLGAIKPRCARSRTFFPLRSTLALSLDLPGIGKPPPSICYLPFFSTRISAYSLDQHFFVHLAIFEVLTMEHKK